MTLTRTESRSLSRRVPSTLGDPRDPRRTEAERRNGTEKEEERERERREKEHEVEGSADFCPISMHRVAESFADVISTWRGPISRDITINAI